MVRGAILAIVLGVLASGAMADDVRIRPLTKQEICATHWGTDARHVSAAMKRRVFIRDGFPLGNKDPRCPCEIDHRVPRDIGGADTEANLQVQQYFGPCNAHIKDRLEVQANKDVCQGTVSLETAQSWFTGDWKAAYRARYPTSKACQE